MIRLSFLHIVVNKFSLLLAVALFISVSIILESGIITDEGEKYRYIDFVVPMAIIICSSWGMNRYRNSESTVCWMTLPATGLEKWLTGYFWTALAAPAIVLLSILLLQTTVFAFLHEGQQPQIVKQIESSELFHFFSTYIFWQSLFFLGTLFFKRNPIIKSISTIAISFFVTVYVPVIVILGIEKFSDDSSFSGMDTADLVSLWLKTLETYSEWIISSIMILCLVLSWFSLNRSNVR